MNIGNEAGTFPGGTGGIGKRTIAVGTAVEMAGMNFHRGCIRNGNQVAPVHIPTIRRRYAAALTYIKQASNAVVNLLPPE